MLPRMPIAIAMIVVSACVSSGNTVPEPPPERQLVQAIACDAHILVSWRNLTARSFRGRVVVAPEQLRPFPGATVAVRKYESSDVLSTRADEGGRFEIAGLKDGLLRLGV